MRKILTSAAALLLITGVAFAQDKKGKTAQKKEEKTCTTPAGKGKARACCMQPSKTTALRAKKGLNRD